MPNLNLLTILGLDSTTSAPDRLLDPVIVTVDHLTDALDHGALTGSGLAALAEPLDTTTADLVGAVNTLLEPLVGDGYAANHPNNLDPVDNLVGSVATTVQAAVGADIDALLGAGATTSLLAPLGLEADYVTDTLAHLTDSLGLGSVTSQLATVEGLLAPVNAVLAPIEGEVFALGGELGAPVTALLADLGSGDVLDLGGLLHPVVTLVDNLLDSVLHTVDTGVLAVGTDSLLAPLAPVLGLVESLDPLGVVGPVLTLKDSLGEVLPLPTAVANVDASGLLGVVGTVETTLAPVLAVLPGISSLGGPLDAVTGLLPALALPSLPLL